MTAQPREPRATAEAARPDEDDRRESAEQLQERLRARLETPIERATELTRKTLGWFPVRVWRHFLQHNGFLLAAGISYQALFAMFATLYVVFAVAGLWLGASPQVVQALIDVINGYLPNLISENGLVTVAQVESVATGSTGLLSVTGAIALGVVVWTAIGFITFTRRAVRDTFGLPFDRRSYFLLKARDLLAALIFGVALLLGAALGSIATWALDLLFSTFGSPLSSAWSSALLRLGSVMVAFAINTLALAALYRFLAGASLTWRAVMPGSVLGGAGIATLQLGVGVLLRYTPSNPLLATFTIFIGFLLWFRLNGIVILVAAAWIAVAADDRDMPLVEISEAERREAEHAALLLAARVRLRDARGARADLAWWRGRAADREIRALEDELAELEASAPPPAQERGLLD